MYALSLSKLKYMHVIEESNGLFSVCRILQKIRLFKGIRTQYACSTVCTKIKEKLFNRFELSEEEVTKNAIIFISSLTQNVFCQIAEKE